MGNWYQGHTLLLDFVMSSSIGAMSYQIALRTGLFAFISAGFWGVGAYAAADIAMKTSYPWALGILIGIVLSAAGGLLLSLLLLRLSGLYLGMATFAFDLVAGVIAQHAGPLTGGAGGLQPIPQDVSVPVMLGIFVVVCLLISQLEVGPLGRSQELIHFDQDLARSLGIRVTAWRHWIFILSAVLGSLSGSLYALTFLSISPSSIGFSTLITGLATVVVGGVASWRGCVIGAIIVIGVPNLFNNLQIWEPVIYGGLLLVVAVFMPEGIFGLWRRLTAAVGDRARPGRAGRIIRPAGDGRHRQPGGRVMSGSGAPDAVPGPGRERLVVEDLCVRYGGVVAVNGVSMAVGEGEVCGLIGPNGSGKSTLLAALSRIVSPASGRLLWEGSEYTRRPASDVARLGIARTFQTVQLVPALSILENVMTGSTVAVRGVGLSEPYFFPVRARRSEAAVRDAAEQALEQVGLAGLGQRDVRTLSYGQQRRVELARSLLARPRLLLLDEPTAGMSEAEREEIRDLLGRLPQSGTSVLVVEHNLRFINTICSRVYVLDAGVCIASGPPAVVSRDSKVMTAYLAGSAQ